MIPCMIRQQTDIDGYLLNNNTPVLAPAVESEGEKRKIAIMRNETYGCDIDSNP